MSYKTLVKTVLDDGGSKLHAVLETENSPSIWFNTAFPCVNTRVKASDNKVIVTLYATNEFIIDCTVNFELSFITISKGEVNK